MFKDKNIWVSPNCGVKNVEYREEIPKFAPDSKIMENYDFWVALINWTASVS